MRRAAACARVFLALIAPLAPLTAGATTASFAGCREAPHEPSPASSASGASSAQPLGTAASLGGVAAVVGTQTIGPDLVARVARAQGIPAAAAARTLVDEAVVAEAAVRAGALRDPNVARQLESAYARAIVARQRQDALALGPFTDDEIAGAMGDEWVDLDAPETRLTAHALVRADTNDGAAIAGAMRARLVGAKDLSAFLEAAKAFGTEKGVPVVAENIDLPVTAEGRGAMRGAGGAGLDATFAKEAFTIAKVGECSQVVKTSFGWHVIYLVAIQPERRATRETKIKTLLPVLLKNRAFGTFEARLAKLREGAHEAITAPSSDLAAPRFVAPELPR
jgi:hypothetical protein